MAAPLPPPPHPTAFMLTHVPSSVMSELLRKYDFIPTSRDLGQSNGQSFAWQESDPQFRQFQVVCTGFTANDGVVFVNRDVLSLISTELKGKILRNETIIFNCSSESFTTVMNFVHSINSSSRPTAEFLLKLLPMLRDCKLQFLVDLCACCIGHASASSADRLIAAFRAENELLLEYGLRDCPLSEMRRLLEKCIGFREFRNTTFGGKAAWRIVDLMGSLPEHTAPPPPAGAPPADRSQFDAAMTRFTDQLKEHHPYFSTRSQCFDFEIKLGNESLFTSRAILAQSSRFFQQLFFGDFAEKHLHSYSIEKAALEEVYALLYLVLPTPLGMLWRLTTAAVTPNSAELNNERELLSLVYTSDATFNEDAARFVNVFKLADTFRSRLLSRI